jgi:type IV fimbrial biogenesis protein FimT
MKGLTLIELLVSVAILTILISTGVPSLLSLVARYQSFSAVSTLKKMITYTRNKAIDGRINTTICPIVNANCTNDWSQSITVFTDNNSNRIIDSDDTIHYQTQVDPEAGYWQKNRANMPFIKFNQLGHAFSSSATLLYCPRSGSLSHARQIIISFQGRVRIKKYLSSNGTPYSNILPLSCL